MRVVTLVVAGLVSVLSVVRSRRAASQAKEEARAVERKQAAKSATTQKPVKIDVPKLPKIKRSGL